LYFPGPDPKIAIHPARVANGNPIDPKPPYCVKNIAASTINPKKDDVSIVHNPNIKKTPPTISLYETT